MANVINRTTLEYLPSAHTPDYPVADWIIGPDMSAVAGQPVKYWEIVGDLVVLKDAAGQAAADLAETEAARDGEMASVDSVESILRAVVDIIRDEINILRAQFNTTTAESNQLTNTSLSDRTLGQLRTAIRNRLGN